ncbi:MAG TPA: DNA-binding response regulator, partial [Chitinophagaceae bacterium]|nr:DNA-binding response regulator [Chitinophagaceae bacterium]
MTAIIIEDEKPAAEKLLKAIELTDPGLQVAAILDSVQSSIQWLQQHPAPDLVFMDIELGDGLSFGIFEKVKFNSP